MRITPHFSVDEFACRDGTVYPAEWISLRLRPLCELLEIVRGSLGAPVRVVSGFRTHEYNRLIVGGARNSQHVLGRAADIRVVGMHPAKVHEAILRLYSIRSIQDLLGGLGAYPNFTHVDIRETRRLVRWSGSRT